MVVFGGLWSETSSEDLFRTFAQQIAKSVSNMHCRPRQGQSVSVTYCRPSLTWERLTILSTDGIGAFDHVFNVADVANGAFPFVRQFYGKPSCFWDDEMGDTQVIPQGEGEQGDPLMPLLFCLGLHRALVAANARLQEGETLFAFLDDVYATCAPDRVLVVHRILQQEIQTHCCISVHHGKNADLEPRRTASSR